VRHPHVRGPVPQALTIPSRYRGRDYHRAPAPGQGGPQGGGRDLGELRPPVPLLPQLACRTGLAVSRGFPGDWL